MSPVNEQQALAQMEQLERTPAEKMAESLMQLAGIEEPQSRSAILSLTMWAATQVGEHDLADLLVRMEMQYGPRETLKKMLGPEKAVDLMRGQGPMEAGQNLMAAAEDQLYG